MTRLGGVSQGVRTPQNRATPSSNNGLDDSGSMMAALLGQSPSNLVNPLATSPNTRKRKLPPDEIISCREKVAKKLRAQASLLQASVDEQLCFITYSTTNSQLFEYSAWRLKHPPPPPVEIPLPKATPLRPGDEGDGVDARKAIVRPSVPGRPGLGEHD